MTNISTNDLLTKFLDTTARNAQGRYIVRLPFKHSFETIG